MDPNSDDDIINHIQNDIVNNDRLGDGNMNHVNKSNERKKKKKVNIMENHTYNEKEKKRQKIDILKIKKKNNMYNEDVSKTSHTGVLKMENDKMYNEMSETQREKKKEKCIKRKKTKMQV